MAIEPGFFVADVIDAPALLDCTVTNIPGSASLPVQVVASLARDTQKIHIMDSTNRFVGLYRGGAGSEVFVCIVGGGSPHVVPATLRAGDRISLRNLETGTISTGGMALQFLASNYV